LTERLNKSLLKDLQRSFNEADEDGSGALDLDEFIVAFGSVLGPRSTREELEQLFMRIDADSDE